MDCEKTYSINDYMMDLLITEAKKGALFVGDVRLLLANLMREWLNKYDSEYKDEVEKDFKPLDETIKELFIALEKSPFC